MTTDTPVPQLQVGEIVSVGGLSHGRLLALAAAAPEDSADPVVTAARYALRMDHPAIEQPEVDSDDVDPATPDRRYSVLRLRGLQLPDGSTRDVMVMRGEGSAVLAASHAGRQARGLLRKNADHVSQRGSRPLVIAAAPIAADGTIGDYRLQGFVAVHAVHPHTEEDDTEDGSWVRISLWSASLRWQHWINVALIFILSCTGYYMMDPFFGPSAAAGQDTGYLMGWIRLIHFTAAFAWIVVGATRIVAAFTSRDRYLRWPTLWPLKSRADLRHLRQVIGHYALISKEAPLYLAHNPLQQLTYTMLYVVGGLQIGTGLVLYSLAYPGHPFWDLIATPIHWFGIPPIRLVHTMVMFGLWAFVIVHVYLAVRADSLERHGGVSAMMNGGVWLRRGSKPVDAPEVE